MYSDLLEAKNAEIASLLETVLLLKTKLSECSEELMTLLAERDQAIRETENAQVLLNMCIKTMARHGLLLEAEEEPRAEPEPKDEAEIFPDLDFLFKG